MSVPSSVFSILLLTADSDVQAQFKAMFKDASVTVARDVASLPKDLPKRPFDVVVLESHPGQGSFSQTLSTQIDPSHTLVIAGSRTVLKRAPVMIQMMSQHCEHTQKSNGHDLSLEDFLDQKMGDFVKGMHNGAAKNLHPMLISAVERPLISSALRETQGNQIQAAELLGLNRNTLRKKITDLHIPLKRSRAKTSRTL
jgi:DNA-binding protein Fis